AASRTLKCGVTVENPSGTPLAAFDLTLLAIGLPALAPILTFLTFFGLLLAFLAMLLFSLLGVFRRWKPTRVEDERESGVSEIRHRPYCQPSRPPDLPRGHDPRSSP